MWLIANGLNAGELLLLDAERLVDQLRATDARLPCTGVEFLEWAKAHGLLHPWRWPRWLPRRHAPQSTGTTGAASARRRRSRKPRRLACRCLTSASRRSNSSCRFARAATSRKSTANRTASS